MKIGKPKYIESPERFWELFEGYRKWTKENPILIEDYVGKDAHRVLREKPRPLTMEGFEMYVCDHTNITYPDLTEYFEEKNKSYKDYFPIASRIKRAIRQDQLEGGMAMIYSQSLTARINGISEKTEVKASIEQPLFPD